MKKQETGNIQWLHQVPANLRGMSSEVRWRLITLTVLTSIGIVMAMTFLDYGTIWDEEVQFVYGEQIINWYQTLFQDRSALEYFDLIYYGGLFDVLANLSVRISPFGIYETRHLINALFGFIGILATWRIGLLLAGRATGVLAALLLALTPTYYGHSFNNPKDIPFAVLATVALYYILLTSRKLPHIPFRLCVTTGLAIGAALGVRVGGVFLLGYLVLFWISRSIITQPAAFFAARHTGMLLIRASLITIVAWPAMLLFWPWAQQAPITRPFEAFSAATRFRWVGEMLFRGEMISSLKVPWDYLPTWFIITLPEAYFMAFVAGGVVVTRILLHRERVNRSVIFDSAALLFSIVFPFLAVIVLRSVLYDANRQFLFVLPPLAVLAAWCIATFLRDRTLHSAMRWAVAAALTASLLLTIVDMVRLHPYQTVFFNRLFGGGLSAANNNYDTDYWGASYREGIELLMRHYRPNSYIPVRVANCAVPFLTGYWMSRHLEGQMRFITVKYNEDPDIIIATKRYRCLADMGRALHIVERLGTPLVTIYERHPRGKWIEASVP